MIGFTRWESKFNCINGGKALSRNLSDSFKYGCSNAFINLLILDFISTAFFISGSSDAK